MNGSSLTQKISSVATARSTRATIALAVSGARGRMGQRICTLAPLDGRFAIAATLTRDHQHDSLAPSANPVDVVIDFSSDEGAARAASFARSHHAALLAGTTALSPQTLAAMHDLSRVVPVIIAPNTSPGIAVVAQLAALAVQRLGSTYQVDIIESHHAGKRDAPSGTARRLAAEIRNSGGNLPESRLHSLRAGDIIGEHIVQLSGPGEIIRISHQATSRDLFALGALRAAAWLVHQPPGLYDIEQSMTAAQLTGHPQD
jgi:4-hydroxy-tetrahydrodipicolinate reductase